MPKRPRTNTDMQRLRADRKARGLVHACFWVTPSERDKLRAMVAKMEKARK